MTETGDALLARQKALLPRALRTAQLALRLAEPGDAASIFAAYTQDPEVARYVTWRPHRSLADSEGFVHRCIACWEDGPAFPWFITRPEDGLALGNIELRLDGHMASIGYVLARGEWGQGYMSEAATAVVDLALALPGIYRVWAVCDVENGASARVMEHAGMQREGLLRRYMHHPNVSDEPRDVFIYAKVS
ncbi:MAG: [ribosomal protein S5]-alanine N-acetyltransferase [Chloroflexota bacterium]|nr:[ribosomal protein S5]-alanine N-acetyltransferase [Chloroflexota bacterium]